MFTGKLRLLFGFVLIVIVSACQPSKSNSTPLIPPTEPPVPTSVPAPTLEPATPVPTADFALEDILGIWRHEDPDRGTLFLVFLEDGTYRASHGSPDVVIHSGNYTLENRTFTFVNGWECPDFPGAYVIRIFGGGKYLLFETLNDTCADRPSALRSIRWDRVEPTPTP